MGGFAVQHKHDNNVLPSSLRVSPDKCLELFQAEVVAWPEITDKEIDDHSKADWLVKSLALTQILWFVTQLVGRWAQGLAVTTLELFTLGIVSCVMMIFLAYWEKPYNVQVPVVLQATDAIAESDCVNRVALVDGSRYKVRLRLPLFVAISIVFGAVHIVAWSFHFPSYPEQVLWRICSIGVVVVPLIFSFPYIWSRYCNARINDAVQNFLIAGCTCIYTLFRLYMFIEMFASLRAVPVSVYQTPQWSQYFPSFG